MEGFLKIFDLTPEDGRMILVCAVLFAIFIRLLSKSLFAPFVALLDARDAASSGALSEAANAEQEAQEIDKQREHKIAVARAEFVKRKMDRIAQAKKEAEELVRQAEHQAQAFTEESRSRIQAASRDLEQQLERNRAMLVQATVQQIIGDMSATKPSA
ncbi:MAG: ATP synthase F0 subunit B [Bdellovibrionota bacterium]|nr:MAG: ATP synthase F0 subunit B [Bdellovibrionota bacterium]